MNEQNVIDAIIEILEEVEVAEVAVLKDIFDHVPNQYTNYPAAYVIPVSWNEDYVDLRDTGINATFRIGVVYTITPDAEAAQKQLRETMALIRNELKKQENIQLGGTVDWSQLTSGNYTFDTKENMVAVCEVDLAIRKRYSRY